MKNLAFVTRRKMVAQGLEAALTVHTYLKMNLLPLIPPSNALKDASVYQPDIIILDVSGEMEQEDLFSLCRKIRQQLPCCKALLLVPDTRSYRELSVQARKKNLIDDFIFYDNSMNYLLAKLAAL